MTEFAPVCGVQIYKAMKRVNKLGDYHLLLTHDILARPEEYRYVFGLDSSYWEYRDRVIILDNSVVEQSEPIADVKMIAEAARIVDANVIVLPDIYKKSQETIESTLAALPAWQAHLQAKLTVPFGFMAVPQGETITDFARCAEALAKSPDIQWWGVPRNMVEMYGSRILPLDLCANLNDQRLIHLLGFSDNIIDDWNTMRHGVAHAYNMMGIDSAVPLRAASASMSMSFDLRQLGPRPAGWLENAEYSLLMQENIDYTNELFGRSFF